MGDFKDFWQLNLSAEIKVKNKGKKTFAEVDDRGVVSLYERAGCDEPFKLSKKNLKSGIVNTTTPYSPGNDYIINKSLHRLGSSQYVLKTTGGETLNFSNRQAVCCQPLLDEIVTPNGCKISYDYGGKKTKRVHTVTSYDRSGTKVEKLHIDRSKKRKVVIQNESEKEVIYNLEKPKTKSIFSAHSPEKYRLASVEKNFGPTIKYTYTSRYKDNLELLIKRSLPDHRFLAMTYEKSEKVSGLYAPAGVDIVD